MGLTSMLAGAKSKMGNLISRRGGRAGSMATQQVQQQPSQQQQQQSQPPIQRSDSISVVPVHPVQKMSAVAIEAIEAQLKKIKETLEEKKSEMPANERAVALSLVVSLSDSNFTSRPEFASKEPRLIVSEFIQEWNKKSGVHFSKNKPSSVEITKSLLDQFEGMFTGAIAAIKNAANMKDPEDPVLTLLKQSKCEEGPSQSHFIFQMIYEEQGVYASEVIKIDAPREELVNLYTDAITHFADFKKKPDEFITKAQGYLQQYYHELLKLNADATKPFVNRWGTLIPQQALQYYFDQREFLYKIYSATRPKPEATNVMMDKTMLMKKYRDYLVEMYARPNEYNHEYSFSIGSKKISLHPNEMNSRSVKILAAFDQYYTLCNLPGDTIPCRSKSVQENIDYAGENGRLGDLKRQGLNFFPRGPVKNAFTPLGVFGDIEALPVTTPNAIRPRENVVQ